MDIIADTNLFLAVALDEPEKEAIIEKTGNANITSPDILPYEIGNALSAMLKRHQITKDEVLLTLEATKNIPVRLLAVDISEAIKIAIEFNIYAYDAYFLQCAKATSYPLCTLDRKMMAVAKELRIPLIGVQP
jgi:predicted nucleic acid-binding protein